MENNEGVRDVSDIVREREETLGNDAWERGRTTKVDVAKLRQWLESVSDYAEVIIENPYEARPRLEIFEAHRGPKTNLHPHGTFIISVR